jgi:DNA repair photolyase
MMNLHVFDIESRSILSRASGYISAYDFTLNPYSGCMFSRPYCYAANFAPDAAKQAAWGEWVGVKRNAVALMERMGARIAGRSIYMSSVTDPYQPIELRLRLTRSLLETTLPHQPRLVVQTRSPFVTRDLDLLAQLHTCRVNVTVTTDDDDIRKAFEPLCPSIQRRLAAVEQVKAAGVRVGICLSPLLPVRDPDAFGARLAALDASVYAVDPFNIGAGRFSANTRELVWPLVREHGWDRAAYERTKAVLARYLPLREGPDGFAPE